MKTVTFCGHREIDLASGEIIRESLYNTIEEMIKKGAKEFLLGGYGAFDTLSADILTKLKESYPHIRRTLVVPYIDRECDSKLYDESVYPPIEKAPKKLAIIKRNEWMIDNSDIVIAYIKYSWGGAVRTYNYATRKQKQIINLYK